MPTDEYIIAQFNAVNNSLSNIQNSISETNKSVGKIEGTQKAQAKSLERVERRLDSVIKNTEIKVDSLNKVTGEIETKLLTLYLEPKKTKMEWIREVFSASNVKIILLIIAAIVAGVLGVTMPWDSKP